MKLTAYVSPRIIFIAGMLFFVTPPVPANEIRSKSTIVAVTVYNDQALITRQVKETVPAGINTVMITNLPWEMIDQSLKVSGISQNEVKISDIKIDQIFLDTIPESRTAELYQRLNLLRNEKNALERNAVLYKSQYDAVDAMKENYTKSLSLQNPGQKASVEEWDKLLQFVEKKKFEYTEKMESIRKEIDGKLVKIKAIENEIRSIGAAAKKEQKEVSVVLTAAASGMVTLEISYRTPNASWIPAYEMRAQAAEKSLQVMYSGNVRQNTGEDWNNVDLTLSTARPATSGNFPVLWRWTLDEHQLMIRGARSAGSTQETANAADRPMLQKSTINSTSTDAFRIDQEESSASKQMTSSTFSLPSKQSVPNDNQNHKVGISTEEIPVTFTYTIVPKIAQTAFLVGKGKNPRDYPLLAGEANIFLDNAFVAAVPMKTVMPNDSFSVNLGVDEAIRVERKLIGRFTEKTGTFTSKNKITYEYENSVQNFKKYPVDIILLDHVPVSANEKFTVEVLEPNPKTLQPSSDGIFTWSMTLQPDEKRTLPLKFSVEYPPGAMPNGL
jgi:uncharacterized protein (TIGR02231 family)